MVGIGHTLIELLQPIGSEGVMAKFLEKRGEGFHHICYEVDDINAEISSLKAAGIDVLGESRPGAEGMSHGVLVELVEKKK